MAGVARNRNNPTPAASTVAILSLGHRTQVLPSRGLRKRHKTRQLIDFHNSARRLCHQTSRSGASSPSSLKALDSVFFAEASASPYWDPACAGATMVAAYAWIKLLDGLAARDVLGRKLSRKAVHITSGPLYVLTWLAFSEDPMARWFAVLPPLAQFVRLLAIGKGWWKSESAVRTISREGGAEELLRGPLYYVVVLGVMCGVFWRDSPLGILAIAAMCGGDGMADIIGRQFGGACLPFNRDKSWAGSAAMLVFGSLLSIGFVYLFQFFGCFAITPGSATTVVLLTALAATVVEALPVTERIDDNISVPITAVVAGSLAMMLTAP